MKDLREPEGFLILGREAELENDQDLQELSRALNKMMRGRIEVRSFDSLARSDTSTWISEGKIVDEY